MSLFAELKRRKVFRVAVVYAATAFVLLQAADLLATGLRLPEWAFPFVTVLLILGFPVAVVLGWVLEVTPRGVRRTVVSPGHGTPTDRDSGVRVPSVLGRGTAIVTAALVLVGIGLGAGWLVRPLSQPAGGAADNGSTEASAEARSLAVLPFTDLSQSGDQKWFADGLAEEILNSLARLPELSVVGRSSSFLFTADATDDRHIADRLSVAHLVKGSVRRVGDRLRVTAQLVRADDGVQLWSEAYDRDAADLLDVQRDVAEKVAAALDVLLDDERRERMFAAGTRNVEAFEAYLRGREIYMTAHGDASEATLIEANVWLGRALDLEPGFARAALLHADRWAHILMDGPDDWVGRDVTQEAALAFLHHDFERAARAAPDEFGRAVAEINRGLFSPTWHRLPALADALRRHAGSGVHQVDDPWGRMVLTMLGEMELARDLAEGVVRSEPLEPTAWSALIDLELSARNLERAHALLAEARRSAGDHPWLRQSESVLLLLAGEREALLSLLDEDGSIGFTALAAAIRGDTAAALAQTTAIEAYSEWPQSGLLPIYHQLGDRQRARDLVRRIDALPAGPAILTRQIVLNDARFLTFDLADAPNFSARLREAGVDPGSLPVFPRLAEARGGAP
jgi:TolB-like protein